MPSARDYGRSSAGGWAVPGPTDHWPRTWPPSPHRRHGVSTARPRPVRPARPDSSGRSGTGLHGTTARPPRTRRYRRHSQWQAGTVCAAYATPARGVHEGGFRCGVLRPQGRTRGICHGATPPFTRSTCGDVPPGGTSPWCAVSGCRGAGGGRPVDGPWSTRPNGMTASSRAVVLVGAVFSRAQGRPVRPRQVKPTSPRRPLVCRRTTANPRRTDEQTSTQAR